MTMSEDAKGWLSAAQELHNLRAELANRDEALRRLMRWGGLGPGSNYDGSTTMDVVDWYRKGMTGPLPALSEFIKQRESGR